MMTTYEYKYENIEDLKKSPDCVCCVKNTKKLLKSEFEKEKDLVDYFVEHIEYFVNSLFSDKVISFEVDYDIDNKMLFGPRGRRIDVFVVGENKKYIIEVKNPKSGTENRAAIGQILDYGREFPDSKKELVIITAQFDENTAKTIRYYNLPIRYIYISKKNSMEFIGVEDDESR